MPALCVPACQTEQTDLLKTFDSSVPREEQLRRSDTRRKHGRKHEHRAGPGRQKNPPNRHVMRAAAWRKFHEQVALYYAGHRDTYPKKPACSVR